MYIAGKEKLEAHSKRRPDSKSRLESWLAEAVEAAWRTPADIKGRYAGATILKGNRAVFNIGGNKYRLVVKINYNVGFVSIRFVGSHAEYDRIDAETI